MSPFAPMERSQSMRHVACLDFRLGRLVDTIDAFQWSPAVVTAIIPLDTVNSLYRVKFTGNEEEENVTLENVKVTESGLLSPGTPGSDADWVKVS